MDPVGFSVGIIGLAGLVSTCIQGFQIIRSMKAFSREMELLFTKLDIENELFVQWAHQCGLLKRQRIDGRLFNPKTDIVIHRILKEISELQVEAANLQRKYLPAGRDDEKCDWGYTAGGDKIGLRRKFMFTIHDKEDFNHLITELGYFVGKLSQMIPSIEQRKATRDDMAAIGCDPSTVHLLQYKPKYQSKHSYRDEDDSSTITVAANMARTLQEGRQERPHKRRPNSLDPYEDRYLQPPPPSYSQTELSNGSGRSSHGSHGSGRSHVSSASRSSGRSRQSSGDAAREMFRDLTFKNGRRSSDYR
ncbi:uncharacterized protein HMPREF1541_05731 [Cyphellophora europaea CBS 101466]|uniref:Prion-inhibition and propagation HeLo domain-containing protein n=1 Tax=Cyphellophora europaea (strain CBS 101466) TaxID=1220924 RepID=W2RT62_CYPE1|nr:uncharacterized protein HMPREF1541_05731 [Cyphellophora europaea CBS 101466]ETN39505.1 hypothetical protein HMPREF1541_05731 [Cyphellophora europaea CBS 101466]